MVTNDIKYVSSYSGLNFFECLELDCYTFKLLLKDAFIYEMNKSEQGQEYLKECYYIKQVKPDRNSLRENFNKD